MLLRGKIRDIFSILQSAFGGQWTIRSMGCGRDIFGEAGRRILLSIYSQPGDIFCDPMPTTNRFSSELPPPHRDTSVDVRSVEASLEADRSECGRGLPLGLKFARLS